MGLDGCESGIVSTSPPSGTSVAAFDVGFDAVVGVSLDSEASTESSSSRFRFRVAGEIGGGAGRKAYSGWYMRARYQCKLEKLSVNAVGKSGYEVYSLFIYRHQEILFAEHIDLGRPLSNAFVACLLTGTCQLGPTTDGHWKRE